MTGTGLPRRRPISMPASSVVSGGLPDLAADVPLWLRTVAASAFPRDAPALVSLALAYSRGKHAAPRRLHPRALGGEPVVVRPGTRDLVTYHDVFVRRYHETRNHPTPVEVIVDVGANIGLVSRWYAKLFPRAEIVAVEMEEDNYAMLQRNAELVGPRIHPMRAAVWIHPDGVQYLADSKEDAFAVVTEANLQQVQMRAPSVTPAHLVDLFGDRDVDLMKMDVEGAEGPLLLEADVSWLSRVRCLQLEIHDPTLVDEITSVLAGAGFRTDRSVAHWAALEAWRP